MNVVVITHSTRGDIKVSISYYRSLYVIVVEYPEGHSITSKLSASQMDKLLKSGLSDLNETEFLIVEAYQSIYQT